MHGAESWGLVWVTAPRCDHAKIRMLITSLILLIAAHWKFRFVEAAEPSEHSRLVAAKLLDTRLLPLKAVQ